MPWGEQRASVVFSDCLSACDADGTGTVDAFEVSIAEDNQRYGCPSGDAVVHRPGRRDLLHPEALRRSVPLEACDRTSPGRGGRLSRRAADRPDAALPPRRRWEPSFTPTPTPTATSTPTETASTTPSDTPARAPPRPQPSSVTATATTADRHDRRARARSGSRSASAR